MRPLGLAELTGTTNSTSSFTWRISLAVSPLTAVNVSVKPLVGHGGAPGKLPKPSSAGPLTVSAPYGCPLASLVEPLKLTVNVWVCVLSNGASAPSAAPSSPAVPSSGKAKTGSALNATLGEPCPLAKTVVWTAMPKSSSTANVVVTLIPLFTADPLLWPEPLVAPRQYQSIRQT